MINKTKLIGPKRKNDNKSKFGVQGPDLNCPDLFIRTIVKTEII
jgi:hypothetical protein